MGEVWATAAGANAVSAQPHVGNGSQLSTWTFGKAAFSLHFGGLTLATLSLPLDRRRATIGEPALPTGDIPPPPARRTTNSVGYVVWSQPLSSQMPAVTWSENNIIYVRNQFPRHSVDLRLGFADILARLSPKSRSTLNRKLKKFREESGGNIGFHAYRTPLEIEEFFKYALPLSKKTYQQRLHGKGLPGTEAFAATAKVAAAKDRVRAYVLLLKNQPVSYLYCAIQNDTVDYSYVGYDPDAAALSPGTVLQYHALADLCAEQRYNRFDFGMGVGQHKAMFATECTACADIFVLDRRLRCAFVVVMQRSTNGASQRIADLLEHAGLKARLRRLLRST